MTAIEEMSDWEQARQRHGQIMLQQVELGTFNDPPRSIKIAVTLQELAEKIHKGCLDGQVVELIKELEQQVGMTDALLDLARHFFDRAQRCMIVESAEFPAERTDPRAPFGSKTEHVRYGEPISLDVWKVPVIELPDSVVVTLRARIPNAHNIKHEIYVFPPVGIHRTGASRLDLRDAKCPVDIVRWKLTEELLRKMHGPDHDVKIASFTDKQMADHLVEEATKPGKNPCIPWSPTHSAGCFVWNPPATFARLEHVEIREQDDVKER